jgi:hypothetical protein
MKEDREKEISEILNNATDEWHTHMSELENKRERLIKCLGLLEEKIRVLDSAIRQHCMKLRVKAKEPIATGAGPETHE